MRRTRRAPAAREARRRAAMAASEDVWRGAGRRLGRGGAAVAAVFFEQIGQLASRRPWRQKEGTTASLGRPTTARGPPRGAALITDSASASRAPLARAAPRLTLAHDLVAGALLRARGIDEAGVEAGARGRAVELVDVEPLDPAVLLGQREHAAQRLGRPRRAEREAAAELHDPARLGEPDVAAPRRKHLAGAAGREAVRVGVVVEAEDLRARPREGQEAADRPQGALDVGAVEDVERDDRLAGEDAPGGRVELREAPLLPAGRLAGDRAGARHAAVDLVPDRDLGDPRVSALEGLDRLGVLGDCGQVALAAAAARVLEGDQDADARGARGAQPRVQARAVDR